jgi:hypothetical protein
MKKLLIVFALTSLLSGCTLLGITDPDPDIPIRAQVFKEGRLAGDFFAIVKHKDRSDVTDVVDVILQQVVKGNPVKTMDNAVRAVLDDRFSPDDADLYYIAYVVARNGMSNYLDKYAGSERVDLVHAFFEGMADVGFIDLPPQTPAQDLLNEIGGAQ